MTESIDHYVDKGAMFVKLFHAEPLPEFVKEASMDEINEIGNLPATAFADANSRRFPLHTPADSFVSASYFYAQPKVASDASIEKAIQKAASFWEIDIAPAKEAAVNFLGRREACLKQASDTSNQVPVPASHCEVDGNLVYGIHSKSAAEMAQDEFLGNYQRHEFGARYKIAAHIIDHCEFRDVPVKEDLFKFAGAGVSDIDILKAEIAARALILPDEQKRASVLDWSEKIESAADKDYSSLRKLASMLDQFDQENNLTSLYGRKFSDPHRSVFNVIDKKAQAMCETVTLCGRDFLASDLPPVESIAYRTALGRDKYAEFKKHASVVEGINALQEQDKRILFQVIA